jgi:hypothetical protein
MNKEIQFQVAYSLSKLTVCLVIAFSSTDGYLQDAPYNFLTLFGTLFFTVTSFLELRKQQYITGLIGIAGLVIFQPILPIIRHGDTANQDLLLAVFIVLFIWVVHDLWLFLKANKKLN